MRWEVIMRGTWVVVGRMVLKVWGLGAEGRMALGMFWKSVGRKNYVKPEKQFHSIQIGPERWTKYHYILYLAEWQHRLQVIHEVKCDKNAVDPYVEVALPE